MLAVIGGSGLSQLAYLEVARRKVAQTPYGEPSGPLIMGRIQGQPMVFLARHGDGHTIAPHQVNYRANLWALKDVGVDRIVAIATVGGIRADLVPGSLLVPDQILDYTWGRVGTFREGMAAQVTHMDFTEPYSRTERQRILDAALTCSEPVSGGGVYATTQGPRLETAAEITRLERDGADVVGMTGMPEAALAREIDLPYAAIAVVANYAAGRGESARRIALDQIPLVLDQAMGRVRRIIETLVLQ